MGVDIHTPTTGSRNSTNGSTSTSASISPELQALMKRKTNIESELDELISVLDTHKVDMNTPLVTRDEFPRSDIDVAQIRSARTQIIRLRNDLKGVLSEIERQLHAHYSRISAIATSITEEISNDGEIITTTTTSTVVREDEVLVDAPVHIGFALVDEVVAESPASRAGLIVGDTIVEFGHLHVGNNERLKRLANVVQMNENVSIVQRHGMWMSAGRIYCRICMYIY
jgi:26S proteasome non-ATPase regulatory subunit 9